MQFVVYKCPHCQEYLKIPISRSSVLCMYCGRLVSSPSPGILLPSVSFRRIISYILLGLLFVAVIALLIAARFFGLGLDCLLHLLHHRIGWFLLQRPSRLSCRRAPQSGHMLTKSDNHRIIESIAQPKET